MQYIIEKLCSKFWHVNSANWAIEHLFAYINPEDEVISNLIESNLTELKSWDYIFGTTPKFQLNIVLDNQNEIRLNIVKGLIKDYEIIEKSFKFNLNDLETLKSGLDFLVNCKLDKNDLVNCFNQNKLLDLNIDFEQIFNFLNKNL